MAVERLTEHVVHRRVVGQTDDGRRTGLQRLPHGRGPLRLGGETGEESRRTLEERWGAEVYVTSVVGDSALIYPLPVWEAFENNVLALTTEVTAAAQSTTPKIL